MGNIQCASHIHYVKPSSEALELKLNVSILIFHTLITDGTYRRYNRTCSYSRESRDNLGTEYISLWLRSHLLCNRVLLSAWFLHHYEWDTLHIVQVVTCTLTIDFELMYIQRAPLWFWSRALPRTKNEWLY